MFKLIGNKRAKIEICSSLLSFSFCCANLYWKVEGMEAGINGGPAFGGWQHCRGGILHMLVVIIA
jgi:hypothetical protein